MKQDIRMAAILERDGRVFLVRPTPQAPWELPGGVLPPENDDIDEEMDAILRRLGVMAPAIEEDFLQTHYFPFDGGQVVYNVYAATDWAGDPSAPPGSGAGWFEIAEMDAIDVDGRAHGAILEAFGLRDPEDDAAEILAALTFGKTASHESGASAATQPPRESPATGAPNRREAGLDVLRTLRAGADPGVVAEAMARQQPELAGDVIDFALGEVWSHPALDRRTRSLQAVAILAALGRGGSPLESHIHGALNHGALPDQVVQTLRMVAVYAGFPAALEAWPVMERVFEKRGIPRPGRLE